jgi:hypothetical protein
LLVCLRADTGNIAPVLLGKRQSGNKGYVLVFFGFDITHKKIRDVFIIFYRKFRVYVQA